VKHHPEILSAGRHGAWCNCSCGWRSGLYMAVAGAHLAFGQHLIEPPTDVLPTVTVTTSEETLP
jgi:hypothetical protein